MKIKSLILALPVLCSACNYESASSSDPASNIDATQIWAREVTGVRTLTVDANYDEPCNILGEDYVRETFNLDLTTKLEEVREKNGCEFEWAGSKVAVAFGGPKPYPSIYHAEYIFDKMYQAKPDSIANPDVQAAVKESPISGPHPEGTSAASAENTTPSSFNGQDSNASNDTVKTVSRITAAANHFTKPAVSTGHYKAVPDLGDKAVWDPTTGAMHVLYNNHIISVTVETKGKPELKKQQAESLAEVMIDRINSKEYIRKVGN